MKLWFAALVVNACTCLKHARLSAAPMLIFGLLACPSRGPGMTFQILHSFTNNPDGPWAGVVQGPDGKLYGVTDCGGTDGYGNGTFFRVSTNGGLEVLYNFRGTNSSGPQGRPVLGSDGCFYGTTYFGGPADQGTVFKADKNGNVVTLAAFSGSDGENPETALVQAGDGNFYGTTRYGGAYGQGTVFRVSPAGALQLVASLGNTNGQNPNGPLLYASDGLLYGTTLYGGTNNSGTIFRVTLGGQLTTLVELGVVANAYRPQAELIQGTNGLLYGTTEYGGAYDAGTVFRMDLQGNFTVLASLDGTNGGYPTGGLVQAKDGNFYGTCYSQVYKVTPDGEVHLLANLARPGGIELECSLIEGVDGNLYGGTYWGGVAERGVVFKLSTSGTLQTLTDFTTFEGSIPEDRLVQGPDGSLYGTTVNDGLLGGGTVFRIGVTGQLDVIHQFDQTNGASPGNLLIGHDGLLYGTCSSGGAAGDGVVFRLDTNGDFAPLAAFTNDNGSDPISLLQARDGDLYGTTLFGGPSGSGVVFRAGTNGGCAAVRGFASADGNYPDSPLEGFDGFLYGVAANGPYQGGVVWKLGKDGTYSMLHAFASDTGYYPTVLCQDKDGTLYGATAAAGGAQVLFSLNAAGAFTRIASIPDYMPRGLIVGEDGNFYGTSWCGSPGGEGSAWVVNRNGRLARLVSFAGPNGQSIRSGLLQGSDGKLYGTTENGGPYGGGIVYALTFSIPEIIGPPLAQTILPGAPATFDVIVYSTKAVTYQWLLNGIPISGATNPVYSLASARAADFGSYSVAVTSAGTTLVSSAASLSTPLPLLSVSAQPPNVVLSWPDAFVNFAPEQCDDLAAGVWVPVLQTPVSANGRTSITVPLARRSFFRLKRSSAL